MLFETDSFFAIGRSHSLQCMPCQDYALSESIEFGSANYAYAIVSDGCSTGGKTDVGSRITALTASAIIKNSMAGVLRSSSLENGFENFHHRLDFPQNILGLSDVDMLATCVVAVVSEDSLYINMKGDGVVAVVFNDGNMRFDKIDWANNMPYYPIYQKNLDEFIQAHQGNPTPIIRETVHISTENIEIEKTCYPLSPVEKFFNVDYGPIRSIKLVAVFTDGVSQLGNYTWIEATKALLHFPTTKGVFVKRRMSSIIRDSLKDSKGPIDDISGAVIRIIHDDV